MYRRIGEVLQEGQMDKLKMTDEKFRRESQYMIDKYKAQGEPDAVIEHMKRHVSGGACSTCGTEYKKVQVKNPFAEYSYYEPRCKCFKEWERERNANIEVQESLELAGVPQKYFQSSFENWDYSVDQGLTDAMKKTAEIVQDGRVLQGRGALLYGMVGTGKTHCAVSMLREVLKVSTYNCTFERSADIISKIIKYEGKDTYIQEVMAYDVIILDDLDKMYMQNEWVKERAFTLLDSIVSSEKVLIATTNLESLRELDDKFGMAISSRIIGQCEMIKFEGTDYRKLKVTRELRKQKEGQHELERK